METEPIPQDYIERVNLMELYFDAVSIGRHAITEDEHLQYMLRTLACYISSGLWLQDYERDEHCDFPRGLKRGVLSQDALYDLLCDINKIMNNADER